MHRRCRLAAALLLLAQLWTSSALASVEPPPATTAAAPAQAEVQIPDTPAGKQLRWVIDLLNGVDPGEVESHFTPEFLKQIPAQRLLAITGQLRAGEFQDKPIHLERIRDDATPQRLTAELIAEAGPRFSALVKVDQATGRMDALSIRPVAPNPPPIATTTTTAPTSTTAPTAPAPAPAEVQIPDTPAGKQLRWSLDLLNGIDPGDVESHFTPEFLKQVPAQRLLAVTGQLRANEFGGKPVRLIRIRDGATPVRLAAEIAAEGGAVFSLFVNVNEASGRMDGLLIRPAAAEAPKLANFGELDAKLAALPGRVNCGVYRISGDAASPTLTPVHALNTDTRLALGSTFKLYILGALAELVEAGQAAWDEKLAIREELKSLPSGDMQLQPAGTEFPISHFADKMISISDNTATDHLLHRVGRERVEAYMARLHGKPELNRPFLSTMEMFRIKLGEDRGLPARYAEADEAARRAMLVPGGAVAASQPNLILASAWKKPVEVERVEWFASPDELARLMADLRAKEARPGMEGLSHALRINPGLALNRETWPGVAYKGGSEPGVISGTWLLKRKDGAEFIVTVSWTNPEQPVDEAAWVGLCTAAVNLTGLQ